MEGFEKQTYTREEVLVIAAAVTLQASASMLVCLMRAAPEEEPDLGQENESKEALKFLLQSCKYSASEMANALEEMDEPLRDTMESVSREIIERMGTETVCEFRIAKLKREEGHEFDDDF